MATRTYSQNVVFGKPTEIDSSVEIKGNLTCSRLVVRGDLTVSGAVLCNLQLQVTGTLNVGKFLHAAQEIRVGGSLTAGSDVSSCSIRVGENLTCSGRVRAEHVIEAGQSITAKGQIEAAIRIHCGGVIQTARWVLCSSFDICCTELRSQLLPYGREFWASLPMLAKWSTQLRDPKVCWPDIRHLATPQEMQEVASTRFGHWTLEGQLRAFLGIQPTTMAPPEAQTTIQPLTFDPPPVPAPPKPLRNQGNPLLDLLLSTVKMAFPDYSANPSYQAIAQALKDQHVLDMDLRQAYPDLNIDLDRVSEVVTATTVPDASVKKQILYEITASIGVRLNHGNTDIFILKAILGDDLKVQHVGNMVTAEDDDQCSFDVLGVFESVITGLSIVPDAGSIFTIMDAIAGVLQSGWAGGIQSVTSSYAQLFGALSEQFGKLQTVNGLIAQALTSDWGKLQQANQMIIDGTLSWPIDDSAAVTAAADRYEIGVFQVLFPLHWSPICSQWGTFSNCTCGPNILWNGNGYEGDSCYWLTYGGYWWGDCSQAENELAKIGVSIEDLTQSRGLWGNSWEGTSPAVAERPSCCPKQHH
jgi:cytoskeletal protein CcmA (bactofilin family)